MLTPVYICTVAALADGAAFDEAGMLNLADCMTLAALLLSACEQGHFDRIAACRPFAFKVSETVSALHGRWRIWRLHQDHADPAMIWSSMQEC